jgi:hypothetical protein
MSSTEFGQAVAFHHCVKLLPPPNTIPMINFRGWHLDQALECLSQGVFWQAFRFHLYQLGIELIKPLG